MTFKEFIDQCRALGVQDSDLIDNIDIWALGDPIEIERREEPGDEEGPGYIHISISDDTP
jgi:hypothetical protein